MDWRPRLRPGQRRERAPSVAYTLLFEERQACAYAGLTYEQYLLLPGARRWLPYTQHTQSKCEVVMQYRYELALRGLRGG